jgi:hypothetical protein
MGEKLDFDACPFASDRVSELFGLLQSLVEIGEPVPVGLLGLGV